MSGRASEPKSLWRGVVLIAIAFALICLALFLRSSSGPFAAMRGPYSFFLLLKFVGIVVLITVAWVLVWRRLRRIILCRLEKRVTKQEHLSHNKI